MGISTGLAFSAVMNQPLVLLDHRLRCHAGWLSTCCGFGMQCCHIITRILQGRIVSRRRRDRRNLCASYAGQPGTSGDELGPCGQNASMGPGQGGSSLQGISLHQVVWKRYKMLLERKLCEVRRRQLQPQLTPKHTSFSVRLLKVRLTFCTSRAQTSSLILYFLLPSFWK
jgi:hypothetical protein